MKLLGQVERHTYYYLGATPASCRGDRELSSSMGVLRDASGRLLRCRTHYAGGGAFVGRFDGHRGNKEELKEESYLIQQEMKPGEEEESYLIL